MRKPRIKEKVWIKNIPQYAPPDGKLCTVTNAALGLVWVKPKYHRGPDLEVDLDDIVYAEPETLSAEERAELVKRFVKVELLREMNNYHIELGLMKTLLKKYPNCNFWRNFRPGFQLKSLRWWLGNGKNDLRYIYNEKSLDINSSKRQTVNIGAEKIGEDIAINQKPKAFTDL